MLSFHPCSVRMYRMLPACVHAYMHAFVVRMHATYSHAHTYTCVHAHIYMAGHIHAYIRTCIFVTGAGRAAPTDVRTCSNTQPPPILDLALAFCSQA